MKRSAYLPRAALRLGVGFGLLLMSGMGWAQDSPAEKAESAPQCIGLALGGGGARGAAHIGVLRVLERERVPICRVAGTSMGAIVGALYAMGYKADDIDQIVRSVDWRDVFNDLAGRADQPMRRKLDSLTFQGNAEVGLRDRQVQLPRGLLQGQKLGLLLRRLMLPAAMTASFDDLPIPFRAVAADIVNGEEVVLGGGDIALAVRASMSVPGAFQPVRVDGRLLVDGGIVNNVPISVVRAMGADAVIAVDVGAPFLTEDELSSPVAITLQVITALMKRQTDAALASLGPGDLLILPDLGDIGSAAFDRSAEAVPLGEAAAMQSIASLGRYGVSAEAYAQFNQRHQVHPAALQQIDFVRVENTRSRTAGLVEQRLRAFEQLPLDLQALESAIGRTHAEGRYERIGWRPVDDGDRRGIEVLPVDKGWGPHYIRAGLVLNDDLDGRSDYQLTGDVTFTGINDLGGEWRNRVDLGRVLGLRSEFYQPVGIGSEYFATAYTGWQARNQRLIIEGATLGEFRLQRYTLGLEGGYNSSRDLQYYAGLALGRDAIGKRIGGPDVFNRESSNYSRFYLGSYYDTLDDAGFPSRGVRLSTRYSFYLPILSDLDTGQVAQFSYDQVGSRGRGTLLWGVRLQSAIRNNGALEAFGTLGGLGFLSGYGERDLIGTEIALARAIWYRRMGDTSRLMTVPVYLGASIEAGNAWLDRDAVSLNDLVYAGSAFLGIDTFLGPLLIGYGRNDRSVGSYYISFRPFVRVLDE